MTNATRQLKRATLQIPNFSSAHWVLRLPLAFILIQQGLSKFPLTASDAEAFGLPFILWALAAFGELAAGAILIAGGLLRNWVGDLLTRLAGAGLAAIVLGVIYVVYWAPILDILLYNQLHVLLFVGGIFFMLAGNGSRVKGKGTKADTGRHQDNMSGMGANIAAE